MKELLEEMQFRKIPGFPVHESESKIGNQIVFQIGKQLSQLFSKLDFLQVGSRFTFSSSFFYILFSFFIFTGSPYRIFFYIFAGFIAMFHFVVTEQQRSNMQIGDDSRQSPQVLF